MASSSSPVLAQRTQRHPSGSMSHHHLSSSSISDGKSHTQHIDHHHHSLSPASPSSFLSHHVQQQQQQQQQAAAMTSTTSTSTPGASTSTTRSSSARPSPHLGPYRNSPVPIMAADVGAPKPFPTLSAAVTAFEDALLDLADSSSEEEEDEEDGIEELRLGASAVVAGSGSGSGHKTSKRGGWAKGAAKEAGGAAFQLVVDVPVWTPDGFADLSTMHSLRDRTLRTLHNVIDDLKIRAGVRTSYRLLSTAQGGAWGCIRVAPLRLSGGRGVSSTSSQSARMSSSSNSTSRPVITSRNTLDALDAPKTASPTISGVAGAMPSSLPRNMVVNRRTTLAAVEKGRSIGRLAPGENAASAAAQADMEDDKNKRETGERVRDAVYKDARGNIDEGRYYVLAVGGQPALVIT